jgi:hypothetical protein
MVPTQLAMRHLRPALKVAADCLGEDVDVVVAQSDADLDDANARGAGGTAPTGAVSRELLGLFVFVCISAVRQVDPMQLGPIAPMDVDRRFATRARREPAK